jgi:hypothetical protein
MVGVVGLEELNKECLDEGMILYKRLNTSAILSRTKDLGD